MSSIPRWHVLLPNLVPSEKQLVFKEVGGNLYSMPMFYLGRLAAEILGSLVPALICGVIIYFAGALDTSFSHFAVFGKDIVK